MFLCIKLYTCFFDPFCFSLFCFSFSSFFYSIFVTLFEAFVYSSIDSLQHFWDIFFYTCFPLFSLLLYHIFLLPVHYNHEFLIHNWLCFFHFSNVLFNFNQLKPKNCCISYSTLLGSLLHCKKLQLFSYLKLLIIIFLLL